jgi:hypothetical protein
MRVKSFTKSWKRTWIAPISQLIAVIMAAGFVVVWGFKLQDRVDRLESQLQAILTSPSNQTSGSISAACTNLADRAAAAMAQNDMYAEKTAKGISVLMSELGCKWERRLNERATIKLRHYRICFFKLRPYLNFNSDYWKKPR